jgi:hypothetical protein
MAEHKGGDRAKTAALPRKSGSAGPYLDGDASYRVRVFAAVDSTPRDTRHGNAGRKGPRDGGAQVPNTKSQESSPSKSQRKGIKA